MIPVTWWTLLPAIVVFNLLLIVARAFRDAWLDCVRNLDAEIRADGWVIAKYDKRRAEWRHANGKTWVVSIWRRGGRYG